jgi:hypothetical protein
MELCKICNYEFKNLKSLSIHFNSKHGLNSKQYYDLYLLKENGNKCSVCGENTTFRNLGVGYLDNCSVECRNSNKNIKRNYWQGKKQSEETIKKRITNTNQKIKQENWENVIFKKYGVRNPTKLDSVKNKISESNKGLKKQRTDEWQKNIIDSKRKNNTLKHSSETKIKITNSLNKHYEENLDREKYISTSNNVKHLSGWYNGLYFRSSLELSFLVKNTNKTLSSCEIKKYAVRYSSNGKIKTYYPDYTDGEFIYEIKPNSLLTFGFNRDKITAAKENFGESYKVITEQECNYIPKDMIKKLIEDGIVVLVKNSEKVFEKYKH